MSPVWRWFVIFLEIAILSALILATRCANYQEVFVAGNVYFTDADCYARMTRVRMCEKNPGLILPHHNFENFPARNSQSCDDGGLITGCYRTFSPETYARNNSYH